MGSSLHRSSREKAVGGKPPYLMPFFGMFGYGGPVATMHLGRCACVSSKIQSCDSVYTLHLEKDALINSSHSEKSWRTPGNVRGPTKVESKRSPHGSFTDVHISGLKMRSLDVKLLRFTLKDIYFPYIQCDDMSGKTSMPIEFQVNGIDLAEIEGGEVATTNLHSCNGPEFVLQLHLSCIQDNSSTADRRSNVVLEANARLKCVYFPIIKGEESIEKIINKLERDGFPIQESYQGFSRVSIRRLGRLLPDARWAWLPFMEPKLRKGATAEILKRCCYRVKCFVDTDSGFNPTPSKTDLAHHHPYTSVLKNFGNTSLEDKKEVQTEIHRDGKKLTLSQLEKQYHEWILAMHERYDDEIYSAVGDYTVVFLTSKDKKLGINSDVVRVSKEIKWKGNSWAAGQKIKLLKGACAGVHKQNVFATLEHILLEGLQEDTCGEARLICRPLGVPEERGCSISTDRIDTRDSISVPLSVIDTGKFIAVDDAEWENRFEIYDQKQPSSIDILSNIYCKQLEIDGGPLTSEVEAGDVLPENIVAVIRPKAFSSARKSQMLDQKFIVRSNLEMSLEVYVKSTAKNAGENDHRYSVRIKQTMAKGLHGIYIFPLRSKIPKFEKAGCYIFSLSLVTSTEFLRNQGDVRFKQEVRVKASIERCRWRVLSDKDGGPRVRVGSPFPCLSVECYDEFKNNVPFDSVPKLKIDLISNGDYLGKATGIKADITNGNSTLTIKDFLVKSNKLDKIRPTYEAALNISTPDDAFSVNCPCQVMPGFPAKIIPHPQVLERKLVPGQIVDELRLEVFDSFGNHVKKDELVSLVVDGFSLQDGETDVRKSGTYKMKVDADGCVDLSHVLKVSEGYGADVTLCVVSEREVIFSLDFQTEKRELRTTTKVYQQCQAGSELENVVFQITNPQGSVDETITDDEKSGQLHCLRLNSDTFEIDDSVRYSFRNGRCTIRAIPLPQSEGVFSFSASHSRYPELNVDIEVHVEKSWEGNNDDVIGGNSSPHESYAPQSSHRDIPPFDYTPLTVTPKKEYNNGVMSGSRGLRSTGFTRSSRTPQSSMKTILPLDYSPSQATSGTGRNLARDLLYSHDLGDWTGTQKDLQDDLATKGSIMLDRQSKIQMLEQQKLGLQKSISELQAAMGRDYVSHSFERDFVRKKIEESTSAAAVICKSLTELPIEERPHDILGVVALLGSAQSIELSRMLSKYIGEEQMLAVVCKNYHAVETLQSSTLNEFASKFGLPACGGLHALCLEDVRPFIRASTSDSTETLALRNPTLPDGSRPKGFLGFAVNMITVEACDTDWRTNCSYGLRETLFYPLLGDLQVYEDHHCMKMAGSCITCSALSLDGVIMRKNGLLSLGNWEPEIHFPVSNMKPRSWQSRINLNLIEERKMELINLSVQLEEEYKLLQEDEEKFELSRQNYNVSQKQNLL